jgi:hypothetical protein
MTKRQENKKTMYQNVDTLLDTNAAKIAGIVALVTKAATLKTKISGITAKDQERSQALSGKAQDKYDAEEKLIAQTLFVSGGLYSYGVDHNDNNAKETGKISESELYKIRDTEVIVKANAVHDVANGLIASLDDYGIDAAVLLKLKNDITDFNNKLGARESATAERGGAIDSLKTLFKETDDLLKTMDVLVDQLKNTEPQFVYEYYLARVIRNLGEIQNTWTGTAAGNTVKNIMNNAGNYAQIWELTNTGSVDLQIGRGTDSNDMGTPVTVTAGQTIMKTGLELGSTGNSYLNVKNANPTEGSYKVIRQCEN